VTGGASGIGQSIAFRLAEAGANVMIADISLEAALRAAEELKARGGKAEAVQANVSVSADASRVAQATVDAFGSVDILVNNAGIYPPSPVLETTEELWVNVVNINLNGMFFFAQSVARQMVKAGHGGKIINVASATAFRPTVMSAHYCTSKGGVVTLTKSLALELAPHRILVNAVAPGAIVSPGTAPSIARAVGSVPSAVESADAPKSLGRWGRPDDIAKVVLFLASASADFMTGSVVVVDAGYLLK
jgi:NAD(P)-dependent dehydrogenase (short-subunit alcohol dehydrogenase family)